jgi:hypothetical protein
MNIAPRFDIYLAGLHSAFVSKPRTVLVIIAQTAAQHGFKFLAILPITTAIALAIDFSILWDAVYIYSLSCVAAGLPDFA